jgi:hypothetical protein
MAENGEKQELVAAEEAAQMMGTTELNVLMHIKRGLLAGREEDGSWYVTGESLTAFRKKSGGEKAQVVCRTGCAAKKGGCSSCG